VIAGSRRRRAARVGTLGQHRAMNPDGPSDVLDRLLAQIFELSLSRT
jgi:hypothetical protein